MTQRVSSWLSEATIPMPERVVGVARLLTMLSQAKLKNVRGSRFAELLDILIQTIRSDSKNEIATPTGRQRGMLRQVVLAHAEHVTLAELRSGIVGNLRQRWHQLGAARRMLAGCGDAPPLPGIANSVSFERIEQVAPADGDAQRIDDLLRRYFAARIEGGSIFGEGYYGWPVLDGFAALSLSVAAVGWLARYLAAADGADRLQFPYAATALGMVDRAATRLPALGTWAERNRIVYLRMDDGIARLLKAYPLAASSLPSTG